MIQSYVDDCFMHKNDDRMHRDFFYLDLDYYSANLIRFEGVIFISGTKKTIPSIKTAESAAP